jgi:hypothetical protein
MFLFICLEVLFRHNLHENGKSTTYSGPKKIKNHILISCNRKIWTALAPMHDHTFAGSMTSRLVDCGSAGVSTNLLFAQVPRIIGGSIELD